MSETKDTQQHPKVEIAVKNFGPIAEADIDLRPLTVFVGPSNTGKTYFATLVYALHGSLRSFPRTPLLNSEPFLAKIRHGHESLEELKMGDHTLKWSDLPQNMRDDVRSHLKNKEVFSTEFKRCFDLDSDSKLLRLVDTQRTAMTASITVNEERKELWGLEMQNSGSGITISARINGDMLIHPDERETLGGKELSFAQYLIVASNVYGNKQCHYLPASRSGITQSHRIIAASLVKRTTRIGLERFPEVPTMSGAIADFMERIILYEEGKGSNELMKCLAETLESDVLAGQIRLKPLPSGYPDFYYRPQGIDEDIRLSQASSMVSELAPLVLFLRSLVNPGDTLIIEEPEAHLHPGAQADMAVILARLVTAGVKVIITTHSDWLLQEIGNLIRVGELEKTGKAVSELPTSLQKEHVGVWHFQKDGKVEEIPYNRIDGVEPMEYLDVAEDLYNRSARLQNRLEEAKGDSARE